MVDVIASVSRESVLGLRDSIDRFQKELGVGRATAFRAAAGKVLNSLGKNTTVANRYRDFTDTGERSRSGLNKLYIVHTKYTTPKRKGKALRRSWQGNWRDQQIWARGVRELKRRPAVIVGMRGLAKESWRAVGKSGRVKLTKGELRTGSAGDFRAARNTRIMKKAARRWVIWRANYVGDTPYIRIRNNLKYIRHAVKSGAVNDAVQAGTRGMLHEMQRRVEKAAAKTLMRQHAAAIVARQA